MRQQMVKSRTAQIHYLRGLSTEFGEAMPNGRAGLIRGLPGAWERVSERLLRMAVDRLHDMGVTRS